MDRFQAPVDVKPDGKDWKGNDVHIGEIGFYTEDNEWVSWDDRDEYLKEAYTVIEY